MRVAVLGAGLMGAQIGCEYALGGHEVVLHARDTAAAWARARTALSFLEEQRLRPARELNATAARLETAATAEEAATGVDLIVESLPENLELKASIVRAALAEADAVMREGLARRWRRVGPLRAIALGGIETWNLAAGNIVPALSVARALPDLAGIAIADGDLQGDAEARDAALATELRSEPAPPA